MTFLVDAVRRNAVFHVAPQLPFSNVRIETREGVGEDATWLGITCDERPAGIYYRIGYRHQFLMAQNGKEWALMRAETLIRLLVKKLARETAE